MGEPEKDIVLRLRQHDGMLGFLVEEAADEIERLREVLRLIARLTRC